jgi:nucleoside 2-deoxyribosyltransferase
MPVPLSPDYRLMVYLAGGMRSDWQDKVIEKTRGLNISYLDPRSHGHKNPVLYTTWDMQAIQRSDVVLAFLEYDNPSGLGMAAEIGYAKGLDKPVIFVNEQHVDHNTAFLEVMSLGYYDTLTKGINQLVAYYRNAR